MKLSLCAIKRNTKRGIRRCIPDFIVFFALQMSSWEMWTKLHRNHGSQISLNLDNFNRHCEEFAGAQKSRYKPNNSWKLQIKYSLSSNPLGIIRFGLWLEHLEKQTDSKSWQNIPWTPYALWQFNTCFVTVTKQSEHLGTELKNVGEVKPDLRYPCQNSSPCLGKLLRLDRNPGLMFVKPVMKAKVAFSYC